MIILLLMSILWFYTVYSIARTPGAPSPVPSWRDMTDDWLETVMFWIFTASFFAFIFLTPLVLIVCVYLKIKAVL